MIGEFRDFIEVPVKSVDQWMSLVIHSEKNRLPCHWMNYGEMGAGRKWLFRGHADANWKIESTLERTEMFKRYTDEESRKKIEAYCIDEFRRRSNGLLAGRELTEFDWVAMMQHYGAPTRLVDFTYSPFVALYFAIGNKEKLGDEFAVWAISLEDLYAPSDLLEENDVSCACYDESNDMRQCEYRIYDDSHKLFSEKSFGSSPHSRIYFASPKFGNSRSNAQSGVFLLQSSLKNGFMGDLTYCISGVPETLELSDLCTENPFRNKCSTRESRVIKFKFQKALRQESILALRSMNIFPHTLFPGLEGIAQTVKWSVNEEAVELLETEITDR